MGGMNGSLYVVLPLILRVLFVAAFVYAMVGSKHKWKTALYTFGAMASILAVGCVIVVIVGLPFAIGTVLAPIVLITGIATALAHANGKIG
jgi:hypothetical protein